MKPWLEGDLSDLDPRTDIDRLRGVVLASAHRGEDLRALFVALGHRDARAAADLAAGPRAVAHRNAVEGALAAADALETVLDPSGLYPRLVSLAPEATAATMAFAFGRHPLADWTIRMSRAHDPVPGRIHLEAAARVGRLREASLLYAKAGVLEGLLDRAARGDVEPIGALWRAGRGPDALAAAAVCLDAVPSSAAIPALAALAGPSLREVLQELLGRVTAPTAAERVRWALVDAG